MEENPSHLYLDLLVKILANTIYGDAPVDQWSGGHYDSEKRRLGHDWPGVAHTMIGLERLRHLRGLCERILDEQIPGDFIETGVWRGGACILMRAVLKAYGIEDRDVILADSFQGLPPPDPAHYPRDEGDQHHTFHQLAVSVEQVRENFRRYDLLDEKCIFLEGFFKDTLHRVADRTFALLRLDGDMYESTIQVLSTLYPRLSPLGFVVVDDYGNIEACRAAVHDYIDQNKLNVTIQPIDGCGVWWRKEGDKSSRAVHASPRRSRSEDQYAMYVLRSSLAQARQDLSSAQQRHGILVDELAGVRAQQQSISAALQASQQEKEQLQKASQQEREQLQKASQQEREQLQKDLQSERELSQQLRNEFSREVKSAEALLARYAALEQRTAALDARAQILDRTLRVVFVKRNDLHSRFKSLRDRFVEADVLHQFAEETYAVVNSMSRTAPVGEVVSMWRDALGLLGPGSEGGAVGNTLRSVLSPRTRGVRLGREVLSIAVSGLFSPRWYLERNPDVTKSDIPAIVHYLRHGGFEKRDPSPLFSSELYMQRYRDVREANVNPLVHYMLHGLAEQRKIAPSVDRRT
ncbi:hypothetical protein FHP25_13540 [Vineibacter terrae]|uniref:Macrocin O-methyltransferase n=2 Tax=Vineibacter terrae TaxID=2586908 RepID=A0A5C8PNV9_9HYPH|nr:hypothetical protein FHP25_13540 [Vineibacter terrae]